ncbi:MAG: hydroxyacylglutathione hydrolase [Candidatus Competibacteraceae bacterium]|nr:hydroxyacylglutathione hydrolase [Candidatus Competibacteraceae bacterium]
MLKVTPVGAFKDNYIWLIRDKAQRYTAIVDPGDAAPVLRALEVEDLTPAAILITHHHADHVGGVSRLKENFPDLPVFGPAGESIPAIDHRLREGDEIEVPRLGSKFRVLDVPGHTAGHIAYYGEGALFCGDTVFAGGCGRLFEGTPQQMHRSLSKLAALPGDTLVYCAHEYTLDNLAFALWVEPDNPDLKARQRQAKDLRAREVPTVPSRLAEELRTNPFFRFDEPTVVNAASQHAGRELAPGAAVFAEVRHWKDSEFD